MKMAQPIRALAALLEDQSSVPSTHVAAVRNPTIFGPLGVLGTA